MRQYESYKCNKCNNVVEVQHVGKGELTCCGTPMECITKDLTSVNLMKAFAGESQARNKYDYFADVAEDSNLPVIAEVFRETAINEMFHARLEFEAYAKMNNLNLDDNSSNLDAAAGGEHYEHTTMYPDFAKIAKEEGHKDIAKLFEMISEVEISHEKRYKEIKHALETKGFYETDKEVYWVCELCGHVHKGKKAPGKCQLCGAPKELFKIKK